MAVKIVIAVGLFIPGLFMIRFARDLVEREFLLSQQKRNHLKDPATDEVRRLFQVLIEASHISLILLIASVSLLVGIALLISSLSLALDRPLVRRLS